MASSIIQSIADCKFKDEYFVGFPKHENPGIIKTLRMLKLFGNVTFEKLRDYEQTVNSYLINNNVKVTSPDGNTKLGTEIMKSCLLYTSPSPRDRQKSRMPSSA